MKKIAIIGAGVSGLTCAQLLKDKASVVVFEKEHKAGGLIRTERIAGSLFHICGGHVFNTRNQNVLDWFWSRFDKENEFVKTERNSVIFLDNEQHIPYPIENFVYLLEPSLQQAVIRDLLTMPRTEEEFSQLVDHNFQSFLQSRFGQTLYKLYFEPYNKKVWLRELSDVPTDWLEGKLPMPTPQEIIFNNFNRVAERQFVHSTFFYERNDGSQLIADRLVCGVEIRCDCRIEQIVYQQNKKYIVNGEEFDNVIYCGNLQDLSYMLKGIDLDGYAQDIAALQSHGTTSVFCEIDRNPYSWIYLPNTSYRAHRIICTGNFAPSNNSDKICPNRITATVEFTDYISYDDILNELKKIPLHPTYLTHHYAEVTYPIQNKTTRQMILLLKRQLMSKGFYFTGRFAEWEYYNMDVCIAAAMKTIENLVINGL